MKLKFDNESADSQNENEVQSNLEEGPNDLIGQGSH